MSTIDATKVVSKDQFDAEVAAAFANVERLETPAEETKILAGLLGVSADTVGPTAVGFPKGSETCANCSRTFTFLDVAETGLKVAHSKEFMVGVMTGKHGYLVNTGSQPFNCHNCGTKTGKGGLYCCITYTCKP
ncbi:hypothetical protein K438DRAFT_1780769 [Mycena galopus ATCC 62051]|nr:hypothetical protein K438DRAFT_1780769 [Mycena galopus ATCC 62051]